jgi:hypothetical protein
LACIMGARLRNGHTKSCGCLKKKITVKEILSIGIMERQLTQAGWK